MASGAAVETIGEDTADWAIRLLSLKQVAGPTGGRYNYVQFPLEKDDMRITRPVVWAVCFTLLPLAALAQQKPEGREQDRRPRLMLRANPTVGIAPARVVFTAELAGGVDDFEDYYCPTVVWEWGDDTQSESTLDCDPYEAGRSEIRRRFTVEHQFRRSGGYKVLFRLKKRDKLVATANVTVQIQPGAGEQRD
jgi:hypothetical protein